MWEFLWNWEFNERVVDRIKDLWTLVAIHEVLLLHLSKTKSWVSSLKTNCFLQSVFAVQTFFCWNKYLFLHCLEFPVLRQCLVREIDYVWNEEIICMDTESVNFNYLILVLKKKLMIFVKSNFNLCYIRCTSNVVCVWF